MKQLRISQHTKSTYYLQKSIIAVILLLAVTVAGCPGGDDNGNDSPTSPQEGINATGTWNFTYTVRTTTCDHSGVPGEVENMTITLIQNGNQLTSLEYPGSSGTIDTSTGEFTLTYDAIILVITLSGTTDGNTASGEYTLSTLRLDTGAACEVVYDFTGTKISPSTKR